MSELDFTRAAPEIEQLISYSGSNTEHRAENVPETAPNPCLLSNTAVAREHKTIIFMSEGSSRD